MKVLLINPPFTNYGGLRGHGGKAPPLNLGYLASYLLSRGKGFYKVAILDAEALSLTFESVADYLRAEKPEVVGITSSTPAYSSALIISRMIKEIDKRIKVVMGGMHPSAMAPEVAGEDSVDFAVLGEGELTFFELLEAIRNGRPAQEVAGIIFRTNGELKLTQPRALIQDLDCLPFPARELMPHHLYQPPPTKRISAFNPTSITSARGCPFRCYFCSAHVVWARKYRYRSARNVVDEIELCVNKFNFREFSFTDELFTLIPARTISICEEILKRKLDIAWICMCRAGQLTPELLKLMKRAGCRKISFGVESGDPDILKSIHKDVTLEEISESIRLTHKAGIRSVAGFMIGNLGENETTVKRTISFAKKLNCDIAAFFIATPLPGTEFYERAKGLGFLRPDIDWKDYSPLSRSKPAVSLPGLDSDKLIYWHRRALREYYLRPRYLARKLSGLRDKTELLNAINGLKLFFNIFKKG